MAELTGKVAIVTGGAAGLGAAIGARLVQDGATVVLTDIDAEQGARTACEVGAQFLTHDVTDERRWNDVIEQVLTEHGQLDILVNNAGILGQSNAASPENTTLADWRRVMSVNVESVFLGCRAGISAMQAAGRGGSIINICSVASQLATPFATAYGASKAAVRHLTKSVAQYCAQEGLAIRCNSLHPGDVYTPLHQRRAAELGVSAEDDFASIRSLSPSGDWVPIEQIAAAVSYLASDETSFVTGTMHIVDGGLVNLDTFLWSRIQK